MGKKSHQFERVKSRIAGVQIADDGDVSISAPAVDVGKSGIRVLAVAQIPPDVGVEFGLHQVRQAVREIEAVDDAGGLTGLRAARVGVVFRAEEFDVGAAVAEVIGELLAQIRGVAGPIPRGRQQRLVAGISVFRVDVKHEKIGQNALAFIVANTTGVQPWWLRPVRELVTECAL